MPILLSRIEVVCPYGAAINTAEANPYLVYVFSFRSQLRSGGSKHHGIRLEGLPGQIVVSCVSLSWEAVFPFFRVRSEGSIRVRHGALCSCLVYQRPGDCSERDRSEKDSFIPLYLFLPKCICRAADPDQRGLGQGDLISVFRGIAFAVGAFFYGLRRKKCFAHTLFINHTV